jgi:hypothetical protein
MTLRLVRDPNAEIDVLYQLPLAEFTPARNALAARLKKEGRAEAAAEVKALEKPSVTAWAVNQLVWRDPETFKALIAAGDRFRDAQDALLTGDRSVDARGATDARDEALRASRTIALGYLEADGASVSPALRQRLTTTLEGLAAFGSSPARPKAGRLIADVDPPGFAALAGLASAGAPPPPRPAPPPPAAPSPPRTKADAVAERRIQKARAALARLDADLNQCEEARRRAAERVQQTTSQADAIRIERRDAEARLQEVVARHDAAKAALDEARAADARAAAAVTAARRAVAEARTRLDEAAG